MKMKTSLIAVLVVGLSSVVSRAGDVQPLWDKHCASCHAKDGSGSTKMGKKLKVKDYRESKAQEELKDDAALKSIKDGIYENGKERMAPYKEKLNDADMKALLTHLRAFKKT